VINGKHEVNAVQEPRPDPAPWLSVSILARKDFDSCHAEFRPLARHRGHKQIALFCLQHVFPIISWLMVWHCDSQGNVAGMLHPRHVNTIPHDLLNLIAEPHIHGLIHQPTRDQRKEHRRDEREADEGRYQLVRNPAPNNRCRRSK